MLKSMTGFGRGENFDAEHRFVVEIKAVNHRYNEIVIRMPKQLGSLEDKIRRTVANTLARGRIDIFITVDKYAAQKRLVRVDKELAIAYYNALRELSELLAISVTDNVYQLAKFPDILQVEEQAEDVAALWPKLSSALDEAIANLMSMRQAEGANIQRDLTMRIDQIDENVRNIAERAPKVLEEYRERLLARLREIATTVSSEPDEWRLLQETALFADRTNITEELVRLRSHLAQFRSAVAADAAVGRKLDFIVQEINRETNTIASKANDMAIANIVVEIKSEIEKVREQIQNIE